MVAAGADSIQVKRGIEKAVSCIVAELKKIHKPVKTWDDKAQIATIASNDKTIGKMIADALEKVGHEGVITVEEGKSATTELEVVEGMQFDRGYLSRTSSRTRKGWKPSSRTPTSSSRTRRYPR